MAWRPWTVLTELFIFYLLGHVCEGQKEVKVTRGEDATLECYGRSGATDILLRWTKPDQQIQGYVFYLKDGHFQGHLLDQSFKDRVKLKDSKWMKNGNFSVILQNVTMNDYGTYECEAAYNNQAAQLLNRTSLKVEEPGQTGGHTEDGGKEDGGKEDGSFGLKVGLPVVIFLLLAGGAFVGYWLFRKDKPQSEDSHRPPAELQNQMSDSLLNSESPADEHRDRNDSKANNSHGHKDP